VVRWQSVQCAGWRDLRHAVLFRCVAFFEELGIFDVWVEPMLPGIKTGCEAERR